MPRSRILFLVILVVSVLVVVIIGVVRPNVEKNGANADATATVLAATRDATRIAGNVVTIRVNYGSEKEAWFKDAVERFMVANPGIRVQLTAQGSMSAYQALAAIKDDSDKTGDKALIPTLWSPAAMIQVNLLNFATQGSLNRNLAISCKPLVLSPLAIMIWEERAKAFETFFKDKGGITFDNLSIALDPKGPYEGKWEKIGGDPNWGYIKMGYTNPQESNSGTMVLVAMANNFYGRAKAVEVKETNDDKFVKWSTNIINGITQPLKSSSGFLMQDYIAKGPGAYDFLVVYEALAIENFKNAMGRHKQSLRIVYPKYNLYSDHPQCLIDHPSITQEQRDAAAKFQEFLLTPDIQKLALKYGFRPADLNIPLFGANTVFDDADIQKAGVGAIVGQEIVIPDGNTVNNLLTMWKRTYNGS